MSPLLKRCNEVTFTFGWILHVYIVCKWLFLSRVRAIGAISKNDSATQHPTRYLGQLSKTLSPHFLPVRVPGIRPDRRSITMSEHLKVRAEISSRSHGYSFARREMQPESGQDLETGGGVDLVTSSGSVGIINPRTWVFCFFFLEGLK